VTPSTSSASSRPRSGRSDGPVYSLLLKAAATALTFVAAAAAAIHVSGHVKSSSAPMHPGVLGGSTVSTTAGGRLSLTPSVRSGSVQAVTSTYAS
jgi:hypothetical protein